MSRWLLITVDIVTICFVHTLKTPDYDSSWRALKSGEKGSNVITVSHELGEVPLIVDVQVKSIDDPNDGYIFQAVGGCPRDDDNPEMYGGIIYVYNDKDVIVSAPLVSNHHPSGRSLYLAKDDYYVGLNNQTSDDVLVRIRAWKKSSVPRPNFQKTNIFVQTGSSDVYIEQEHGIGGYPAFVLVRTKRIDGSMVGTMSDAVGASMTSYNNRIVTKNGYLVHGYNEQNVRVWITSDSGGFLFFGVDGYSIDDANAQKGDVEIYAWSDKIFQATRVLTTELGPNIANERFEMSIPRLQDNDFVRAWVESKSGKNRGYRFLGSGALAYSQSQIDPVCSYGGLVYGYGNENIRFWRPAGTVNAGLVCIGDGFGDGSTSDMQVGGKVVVKVWIDIKETNTIYADTPDVLNKCTSR